MINFLQYDKTYELLACMKLVDLNDLQLSL